MSYSLSKTRNIFLKVKLKTLSKPDGSINVSLVLFQCNMEPAMEYATWNI